MLQAGEGGQALVLQGLLRLVGLLQGCVIQDVVALMVKAMVVQALHHQLPLSHTASYQAGTGEYEGTVYPSALRVPMLDPRHLVTVKSTERELGLTDDKVSIVSLSPEWLSYEAEECEQSVSYLDDLWVEAQLAQVLGIHAQVDLRHTHDLVADMVHHLSLQFVLHLMMQIAWHMSTCAVSSAVLCAAQGMERFSLRLLLGS